LIPKFKNVQIGYRDQTFMINNFHIKVPISVCTFSFSLLSNYDYFICFKGNKKMSSRASYESNTSLTRTHRRPNVDSLGNSN